MPILETKEQRRLMLSYTCLAGIILYACYKQKKEKNERKEKLLHSNKSMYTEAKPSPQPTQGKSCFPILFNSIIIVVIFFFIIFFFFLFFFTSES